MTSSSIAAFDPLILGALPQEGGYFNVVKIIVYLLAVVIWTHSASWTNKDLRKLRVPLGFWIPGVFASGFISLVIWLVLPVFWIGLAVYALVFGPVIISYVVFRNRRVAPAQTVLTMAHLQRLGKSKGKTKEEAVHGKDRVRIKDATGKTPAWPTDPEQHAAYQAMQDLLFDAVWRRVSDMRLDLLPNQPMRVIYRIDGVDREREAIDPSLAPGIIGHLKRIAGGNPDEHRRPQSGGFKAAIGAGGPAQKSVEVDMKTSGSTAGERMVLKLFAEEAKFKLTDVGFTKAQLPVAESLVKQPRGVIIVSGPKGSGITSTLYAIIRAHDAFMQNIHTLEITKSLDLENVTQHVYDSQDGTVSFGKRFRSILRTEPDIAMAGDTPDAETASLAAAAGRQGKKVYLGMTASSSFTALRRYLQAVEDKQLAASSLVAIFNQRLTRVLCTNCRRAYKPDPAMLRKANLPVAENRPWYRPPNPDEIEVDKQGNPIPCPVCQGSGYVGRTAVIEMLVLDDGLRELIARDTPLPQVQVEARKRGMQNLQDVAIYKVYEGITSINEILRVTRDTQAEQPVKASA